MGQLGLKMQIRAACFTITARLFFVGILEPGF
jgi:hypothetical protein